MTGKIGVVSGSLEAEGKNLAKIKNEVESILQTAWQQVKELQNNEEFIGQAGTSFQTEYDNWHAQCKSVIEQLDQWGLYLQKAGVAFETIDQQFTIKG